MRIKELLSVIEELAPLGLQEGFDNSGIQVGDANVEATGVLFCIDVTEDVVDEAITLGCNIIIAHHPLLFKSLKSITGKSYIERCVVKAIKNDILIYAAHTNLDNAQYGINHYLGKLLNLQNQRILAPQKDKLVKLATYVPHSHSEQVRMALFNAGAGSIGDYDQCSYNINGQGTFRAGETSHPFTGTIGKLHLEPEIKIEVVLPSIKTKDIVRALLAIHPYEVPAYDIYNLNNEWEQAGSGIVGTLPEEMDEENFLYYLKDVLDLQSVQFSKLRNKPIRDVAIAGGSGSFLIPQAIAYDADIFITGEVKYNDFYDVEDKLLLAVVGHYESEIFTKNVMFDYLSEKYPTFAIYMAGTDKNPVKYL